MAVEARSDSPWTVVARENAIAESARESHSTASSALPRLDGQAKACPTLLEVHIIENRKPAHMNLRRHRDRPQPADILIERPHLHADRCRPPRRQRPEGRPPDRRGRRRNLLIHEPAERELVGQHKRLRPYLDGSK